MKRLFLTSLSLLGMSFGLAMVSLTVPVLAATPDKNQVCQGLGGANTGGESGTDCTTGGVSVNSVVATVINLLSIFIGIVAVIMIMVGGFKYITANGDSGNISTAKNTIIYAVIGLVIAVLARFIVMFVIDKTTTTPPPKESSSTSQSSTE